jgi:hypothetical protein
MSTFIAALPMYEWPETRDATDAEWARFRAFLQRAGIEAPQTIVRRNAEMPAVPGGIRDGAGKVIAPDPATLPPDEFDFKRCGGIPICCSPDLLGADGARFGAREVVGQPTQGFEGGQGQLYSSDIDAGGRGASCTFRQRAPRSSRLDRCGARFAYNSSIPCRDHRAARDLEALGESPALLRAHETAHTPRSSGCEGRADVCATTAARHRPSAEPRARGGGRR